MATSTKVSTAQVRMSPEWNGVLDTIAVQEHTTSHKIMSLLLERGIIIRHLYNQEDAITAKDKDQRYVLSRILSIKTEPSDLQAMQEVRFVVGESIGNDDGWSGEKGDDRLGYITRQALDVNNPWKAYQIPTVIRNAILKLSGAQGYPISFYVLDYMSTGLAFERAVWHDHFDDNTKRTKIVHDLAKMRLGVDDSGELEVIQTDTTHRIFSKKSDTKHSKILKLSSGIGELRTDPKTEYDQSPAKEIDV